MMLDRSNPSSATFLPITLSGSLIDIVRKAREPREKALSKTLVGDVSTDGKTGRLVGDVEMSWFSALSSGVELDSVEWRSHKFVLFLRFVGAVDYTRPSSEESRLELLAGSASAATP